MVDIVRSDSPEICPECGAGGDEDIILTTVNSSLSICNACGTLCIRLEREEGEDHIVNYYHWYPPTAITTDLLEEEEVGP